MPLISRPDVLPNNLVKDTIPVQEVKTFIDYEPSFIETMGAELLVNTTLGSIYSNDVESEPFDPSFNWGEAFNNLSDEDRSVYADNFVQANSRKHFDMIKAQIDKEKDYKNVISQSGLVGIPAALAAQILDPINLIPISAGAKMVKTGSRIKNVLQGSAAFAVAGAATTSVQEAILQTQQETRTFGESAANVGAAALLSGVFGAGFSAFYSENPIRYKKIKEAVEKDLEIAPDETFEAEKRDLLLQEQDETDNLALLSEDIKAIAEPQQPKSLSSAGSEQLSYEKLLEREGILDTGIDKALKFQDPVLRTLSSPNIKVRQAVQELVDIPFKLRKNLEGEATPTSAESLRKIDEGRLANAIQFGREQYLQYKKRIPKGEKPLTLSEFKVEVGYARRRANEHAIPEVKKTAEFYQKNIYDFYIDELKKVPQFNDEDLPRLDKKSFVNRVYLKNEVIKRSTEFTERIVNWLIKEAKKADAPSQLKTAYVDLIDSQGKDKQYFIEEALKIQRNIVGMRSGVLQTGLFKIGADPKSIKTRKLTMSDLDIEDFLESDIEKVATAYSKLMSSRLRTSQKFGYDFLEDTFTDAKSKVIKNIKDDYRLKQAAVIDNPKKLEELRKAEERDINDILALRDKLLGRYGYTSNPTSLLYRFQKQAKQLNVLRMLGGVAISAIPDLAKVIGVRGFTPVFTDGLIPIISNLQKNRDYYKKAIGQLRKMGVGLDLTNASRFNSINDILDDFHAESKFERGLDYLGSKFQTLSLIGFWNTGLKSTAATLIQNNIYDAIARSVSGKASAKDIADLAASGFSKGDINAIHKNIIKYGEDVNGLLMPNLDKWKDTELADKYAAAISKLTDNAILTPGVGTTPLWFSRQGLNLFAQFKSFAFSSVQKMMIPAIQDIRHFNDLKTVQMLGGMVGFGVLAAILKRLNADDDIPNDPAILIAEGIDRSGIAAWFLDANSMVEKASNYKLGLSRIFGDPAKLKRYSTRTNTEVLLGPTGDLVEQSLRAGASIISLSADAQTLHQVRKIMPYQNLLGVKQVLDLFDENANINKK